MGHHLLDLFGRYEQNHSPNGPSWYAFFGFTAAESERESHRILQTTATPRAARAKTAKTCQNSVNLQILHEIWSDSCTFYLTTNSGKFIWISIVFELKNNYWFGAPFDWGNPGTMPTHK